MKSPVEAYVQLLRGSNRSPSEAADVIADYMPHQWNQDQVPFDSSAPPLQQLVWVDRAWLRFTSDDPVVRKQIAAHCLFRAASHLPRQEQDAIDILMALAMSLVGEVVNNWLERQ
jgi:hypothetical protein